MRIKCPALLKNPLLTNQVAGWHRRDDPARRSSVLTWPCMRVLVVEPEIDWHASTRAMESLAIPFEQPAHSDWAIHRGKHRFLKPAYANCINRLNPSQVEIQGRKEQIKRQSRWRKIEDFVSSKKHPKLLHHAVFLQIWPWSMLQTPLLPIQTVHDIFTPSWAHFRVTLTSSGVNKNTGIMTAGHEWEIICSWSNFIRKLILSQWHWYSTSQVIWINGHWEQLVSTPCELQSQPPCFPIIHEWTISLFPSLPPSLTLCLSLSPSRSVSLSLDTFRYFWSEHYWFCGLHLPQNLDKT